MVQRYERAVLAVACRILRCTHDGRDVAQEAFVTAFERLNQLGSPDRFGAWLLRIARRLALRFLRCRRPVAFGAAGSDRSSSQDASVLSDGSRQLMALIERLPDHERVVILLRHMDELPVSEIAQITGHPVGTVTKQLSRSHARLRSWLEGEVDHA